MDSQDIPIKAHIQETEADVEWPGAGTRVRRGRGAGGGREQVVRLAPSRLHFASEWGRHTHCYPELLESRNKGHRLPETRLTSGIQILAFIAIIQK